MILLLPILLLKKFLDGNAKAAKSFAILVAWLLWMFGIVQASVAALGDTITKFMALDMSAFYGVNFAGLDYIGVVNAIIPLSEFLALLSIYLTAWGLVIVLRWIKSIIPTMGN